MASGDPPPDAATADVELDGGRIAIALRRRTDGADRMTDGGPGVATGSDIAPTSASTRAHWLVFFGIAGTVVILDQLTKSWLVANVSPGEVVQRRRRLGPPRLQPELGGVVRALP